MKKLLWVILVLFVGALGFLGTHGLFSSVAVQQGEQGGFVLIGLDHVGPYHEIGALFQELREEFPEGEFVGVFLDDPETIPEDSLRSFAGVKMNTAAEGLDQMAKHPKMRVQRIEKRPAHYVDWEGSRNMISIILGTMKAYPALSDACETTGWSGNTVVAYEAYSEGITRFVMQY